MPAGIVDWVLLQLRQGDPASPPMDSIATRAALLLEDGTIVDIDGAGPVDFAEVPPDDYYVVVYQQNHLGVMSKSVVALTDSSALYDFTVASTQAHGTRLQFVECCDCHRARTPRLQHGWHRDYPRF